MVVQIRKIVSKWQLYYHPKRVGIKDKKVINRLRCPSSQPGVKCLPWCELLSDVMTSYQLIRGHESSSQRLIRFRSSQLLYPAPRLSDTDSLFIDTGFSQFYKQTNLCRLVGDDLFTNLLKMTLGEHALNLNWYYILNKQRKEKLPNYNYNITIIDFVIINHFQIFEEK